MTTEFVGTLRTDDPPFTLIEQQGLLSRLIQALESAITEFFSDPRGFVRELLSTEAKDAKRRKRIYLGLASALVLHVALIVLIAALGWRAVFEKRVAEFQPPVDEVTFPEFPRSSKRIESTKPEIPKGAAGGGGGGQHTVLPPSKGEPPRMLPTPVIVNMNPSNISEPTLAVSPTVVGPASAPPPPAPIGDPTGKTGDFSGGPGDGGGIGKGKGPGVGPGKDAGVGPGGRGGKGGGPAGLPNRSGTGVPAVVDFTQIKSLAGYRPWTWIHKERAVITPEARENKIIGTVVLRANFNADGTITDIEVAMPVDFMNEAAVESLRRCSFNPATLNGVPVSVRRALIRIEVHY